MKDMIITSMFQLPYYRGSIKDIKLKLEDLFLSYP
jgi:hypothetical protein